MDGYGIPHEDIYDVNDDEDWLKDDPEYQKACAAAAGNGKENSSTKHSSKKGSTSPAQSDSRVWLGKYVDGEITPINDVLGEERPDVIFRGKLVRVEFRETKTKRIILNFQMADKTNGISAQKFLDIGGSSNSKYRRRNTITAEELEALKGNMKEGAWVRVHGDVKYSDYLNDYVLNVDSIMPSKGGAVEREDTNPTPRVELHLHTVMSGQAAHQDRQKMASSGHCRHRPRRRPVLSPAAGNFDG